ncbi:MAG: FGGY family carbohydrate kinase, partial [Actinomycetota bacterium]|nr:FGGY family carbohydrate kinase [Actinomycetota bacterium]
MDRAGQEHAQAAAATPFQGGEMSVDQLRDALAATSGQLGDARARVAAVGVAGMAESGAPVDRAGRPLAPIIAWNDPRGAEVVDRLQERFGPDLERAIGQRLRTVSSVAKLGWLVGHGVGPVACWLGVPELVLRALTGAQATEFSLAARTGGYHVGQRRYLPEVAEAVGVRPDVFPEVKPAGCAMGWVSPSSGAWSGLPVGTPVTVAGHDHLVGVAGSGAGPGDLVNSVGTAETVVARQPVLPDLDRALSLRVAVTVMPGGKGWALLASAARSGIVLAAVAEALGCSAEELDRHAVGEGRVPDGDRLVDAAVEGEPIGLPPAAPGAVWNGVLAALAARTWDAVDRLGQVTAQPDAVDGLV